MFDSYLDKALQYRDGVLRNELLECNEEGALKGDRALDVGQPEARLG